jgi:hypothetical protein
MIITENTDSDSDAGFWADINNILESMVENIKMMAGVRCEYEKNLAVQEYIKLLREETIDAKVVTICWKQRQLALKEETIAAKGGDNWCG